jgi:hypothetical protein
MNNHKHMSHNFIRPILPCNCLVSKKWGASLDIQMYLPPHQNDFLIASIMKMVHFG